MNGKTIKILCVDDNVFDQRMVQQMLARSEKGYSFQVESVMTRQDAQRELWSVHVESVLLDLSLPDSTPSQTLEWMKEQSIPVIVFTGNDDDELIRDVFAHGAQDYLVKGQFNRALLTRSIIYTFERSYWKETVDYHKSLVEIERKYHELYENMKDGFVVIDLEGNIKEFNSAFQKMLGYDAGDFQKVNYADITPDQWQIVDQRLMETQVMKDGYSELFEKEYIAKDGHKIPVELRMHLIRDTAGNPSGYWAFVHDITRRKSTEENLQHRLEELKQYRDMTVDRENRMIQLKQEVNRLAKELGRPEVYNLSFLENTME